MGREDAWAAVMKRWLREDAEWNAVSQRNKANRGNVGTHSAGACPLTLYQKKLVYMEKPASISPNIPT